MVAQPQADSGVGGELADSVDEAPRSRLRPQGLQSRVEDGRQVGIKSGLPVEEPEASDTSPGVAGSSARREHETMLARFGARAVGSEQMDAALIAAAQRVEHYEIAAYGCVRNYAELLGYSSAARLLQQTLDEEEATDKKLSALAESGINEAAVAVGVAEEE